MSGKEQVIIRATELTPFPPDFLKRAVLFRIMEGGAFLCALGDPKETSLLSIKR